MWLTWTGGNLSSAYLAFRINQMVGASYTADTLERAYKVGEVYRNGGIWYQRIA